MIDELLKKYFFFILLLVSGLLSSCVGLQKTQLERQLVRSNCNQHNVYDYTSDHLPEPIDQIELDTALSSRFDSNSLNVAHAIGILSDLTAYVNVHKDFQQNPTLANRLDLLALSQKINQRINVSSLEISAVASEIDCEEERADQIASYLKGKEDNAETKFTVGAIVVGAAGAIAAGWLLASGNETNVPDFIGIGAGVTEATLGLAILLNKRKVNFDHSRNALSEIWEGQQTSTLFPPFVWYYLNYESQDQDSLRDQIIQRWMSFERVNKNKKNIYNILFGKGGTYTAEQLVTRANMLDQLEAHISLMKQDLKGLALELERLN